MSIRTLQQFRTLWNFLAVLLPRSGSDAQLRLLVVVFFRTALARFRQAQLEEGKVKVSLSWFCLWLMSLWA